MLHRLHETENIEAVDGPAGEKAIYGILFVRKDVERGAELYVDKQFGMLLP